MERWKRGAWLAWPALAVLGGCTAPPVRYPPDRGHPFDPERVAGFQRGVTTREEALEALGEPTWAATNEADGSTTLTWQYSHTDAAGTVTQGALLKFDADGRLLTKYEANGRSRVPGKVSQSSKAGGTPPN